MKHLPIPFEQTADISISNSSKIISTIKVELATSPIEHFQAMLYRTAFEKKSGLLFIFENPAFPTFVNTKVSFPVDMMQFNDDKLMTYFGTLTPSSSTGNFITSFQTKYLLITQLDFLKNILLKSSINPIELNLM